MKDARKTNEEEFLLLQFHYARPGGTDPTVMTFTPCPVKFEFDLILASSRRAPHIVKFS